MLATNKRGKQERDGERERDNRQTDGQRAHRDIDLAHQHDIMIIDK